jgi:hypothetical protein
MKLNYFVKEGEYTHRDSWDGDFGFEFEYKPKQEDVDEELMEILKEVHFGNLIEAFPSWKEDIEKVIRSILNADSDYYEEVFREELTERFREEAMRNYY